MKNSIGHYKQLLDKMNNLNNVFDEKERIIGLSQQIMCHWEVIEASLGQVADMSVKIRSLDDSGTIQNYLMDIKQSVSAIEKSFVEIELLEAQIDVLCSKIIF